ncbi:hypothetical protein B0T13DRAFT_512196 [Neurospora crassa]|nr:hypothetical protein B0T13DRAFT_512196 [Neurospora crassa]
MSFSETEIEELLKPTPSIESLIAEGFNENFGDPGNTTLLPLDPGMLEAICRVNLPDIPLERLSVAEAFLGRPLGFGHFDAISRMKQAVCSLTYVDSGWGLEAAKDLGNYAVKSKNECAIVWTRWTSVVQMHFPNIHDDPSELFVDIPALAIILDRAMKSHRGTIDDVPHANLDEDFTLPDTYNLKFHETATIKARFSDGIHRVREYRVVQGLKSCVVEDDTTTKYGRSEMAGGRFHSKLKVTFCRKDVSVAIRFLTAHKSSLWPRAEELKLLM